MACLSRKRLYSYFAEEGSEVSDDERGGRRQRKWKGGLVGRTPNVLLHLAIALRVEGLRWGWVPDFVVVIDRVRLDIAHLLHLLVGRY